MISSSALLCGLCGYLRLIKKKTAEDAEVRGGSNVPGHERINTLLPARDLNRLALVDMPRMRALDGAKKDWPSGALEVDNVSPDPARLAITGAPFDSVLASDTMLCVGAAPPRGEVD